jgi:ribonuclease HII
MGRRRDRTLLLASAAALDGLAGPDNGCAWPALTAELALARAGRRRVVGVDEVGRGALAGPLVAAAVALPPVEDAAAAGWLLAALAGVRDSKQLPPAGRRRLAARVRAVARGIGLAVVPEAVIDALGIGPANRLALRLALADLPLTPDYVLVDAVVLPGLPYDQTALVRGDRRCLSIAAAAIVAKVVRDDLLDRQAARYPGYGFERHKGYGTAEHLGALADRGPCPLHRRGFAPVKGLVAGLLPAPAGGS